MQIKKNIINKTIESHLFQKKISSNIKIFDLDTFFFVKYNMLYVVKNETLLYRY